MPKYVVGNIMDALGCVPTICITTNGFVKKDGSNVMGAGLAKKMSEMFPWLPKAVGDHIKANGHNVGVVGLGPTVLVSFPTKPASDLVNLDKSNVVPWARDKLDAGNYAPGFYCESDLRIIKSSCIELMQLLETGEIKQPVLMPIAGCGAGCLKFAQVKPILDEYLSDEVLVMSYKESDFEL